MYSSTREKERNMATRATYQFKTQWSGTHTVYIHHDGYPEGAAKYLTDGDSQAIYKIENFIRNNKRAELTESHEAHGDTEFRYTIQGLHILAEERLNWSTKEWSTIYNGCINHFINDYK
jgi:hypothetical protein